MADKSVIYVTTSTPSVVGHGGAHRSYQILHELEQLVGPDHVLLFTKHELLDRAGQKRDYDQEHGFGKEHRLTQWARHRSGTAKRIIQNPYRLVQRTEFAT